MVYRMIETEHISVQTEPTDGVVTVAIFHVAANGMSHVGCVDSYLVLTTGFKTELHKRLVDGAVEHTIMRDGVFTSIVNRRAEGEI